MSKNKPTESELLQSVRKANKRKDEEAKRAHEQAKKDRGQRNSQRRR